jgi:hypothetical protein
LVCQVLPRCECHCSCVCGDDGGPHSLAMSS